MLLTSNYGSRFLEKPVFYDWHDYAETFSGFMDYDCFGVDYICGELRI